MNTFIQNTKLILSVKQNSQKIIDLKLLFSTVEIIVKKFMNLVYNNRFIVTESLFQITSKVQRDIVFNQKSLNDQETNKGISKGEHEQDLRPELAEVQNKLNFSSKKEKQIKWSKEEDQFLIDNYEQFIQLGEQQCFKTISNLLQDPLKCEETIDKRIKTLKLEQGKEKALQVHNKIHQENKESVNINQQTNFESFKKKVLKELKKINNLQVSENILKLLTQSTSQLQSYKQKQISIMKSDFPSLMFQQSFYQEIAIVPQNIYQCEALEQSKSLLKLIGLKEPGEFFSLFWRMEINFNERIIEIFELWIKELKEYQKYEREKQMMGGENEENFSLLI